ncbi:MAG TPA: hypothetical protein VLF68_02355 [Candidatus Saccharimonadales bacterium]|nr:hypothetical protein [Candidatus Saccharimonadales bacterium]
MGRLAALFITALVMTLFVAQAALAQTVSPTPSTTTSPTVTPSPSMVIPSGAPSTGRGM